MTMGNNVVPARAELATLLDVPAESLTDRVSLRDELALDSLAQMRVLTWMQTRGVRIAAESGLPKTVGELLALVDKAPRFSVQIGGGGGGMSGLPTRFARTSPPDPLVPVLETPVFRLMPVTPDDVGFLYALAVRPETGFRWRYRGSVPPVERFNAELWNQVLLQFVVRRIENDEPVGQVVAYGDELSLRHTYIGAVFQPAVTGTGLAAQAVALFARHLFHTFPLNKIYMEIPGINWPQVQSGQNHLFHVEGVLREHDYYAGRLWDKYICALYPEDVNGDGLLFEAGRQQRKREVGHAD
ncbi:GNAT family protein [Micromonospora echinofusca]|uniref:GNAT family protein n=1 Tax=Micromonospora echinofusca TaxID=47858 RepID=UPI003446FEEA